MFRNLKYMTIKELNLYLTNILNKAKENPNIAFFLIQHFENISNKLKFIEQQDKESLHSNEIINALNEYMDGKPLSKIIGKTLFYNHEFIVNNNVFSPRLETELLVELAINKIKEHNISALNVADICCGTGVIGLSIKSELPSINLYQSDIDENAYFNTLENAKKLELESNVNLSPNLEYYYKSNISLDVIISNPPYIAINDINVGKNVNKYDPLISLYCADNGLMVYKTIIQQSLKVINKNSFLMIFEIGFNQGDVLTNYVKNIYPDVKIEIIKDYANLDRILVITKNW